MNAFLNADRPIERCTRWACVCVFYLNQSPPHRTNHSLEKFSISNASYILLSTIINACADPQTNQQRTVVVSVGTNTQDKQEHAPDATRKAILEATLTNLRNKLVEIEKDKYVA